MNPFQHINQPGVFQVEVSGLVGKLEVEVTVPDSPCWDKVALLGHPHPLYGGTMHNKVVSTLVRAYTASHIPSIRFNFRGVGLSDGIYDSGVGESQDMLHLATLWQHLFPQVCFCFAGFSFGSYVAYRAAALCDSPSQPVVHLISVAPSVEHFDYAEFSFDSACWVILQGEEDEVVSAPAVFDFALRQNPPISVIRFAQTGHFFHGKLIALKEHVLTTMMAM
jgi:alpha/beta superfamily hydrolase